MSRLFRRDKKTASTASASGSGKSGSAAAKGQKKPSLLRRLFRRGGKAAPASGGPSSSGTAKAGSSSGAAAEQGLSNKEKIAQAKARIAAQRAAGGASGGKMASAWTPDTSMEVSTSPSKDRVVATSTSGRVPWGQAEAVKRAARKAAARQAAPKMNWLGYALRVAILLVAVGVVTWVYQGDAVLALIVLICEAGVFARAVAAKVVPRLIGVVAATPFALAAIIPAWNAVDALLRQDSEALIQAGIAGGLYALAVLILFRLPRSMGGPFQKWLP